MNRANDYHLETANGARPTPAGVEAPDGTHHLQSDATEHSDHEAAGPAINPHPAAPPPAPGASSHPWRRSLLWAGALAGLAFGGYALAPTVEAMMETVSTDDVYVNGHVTYVAPRVAGQVSRVPVDDNDRVKKGDLLVQLDREPYQVQTDLKRAAVANAEVDVEAARAQVRGILAQARSQRWKLQTAIEDVDDKVAQLKVRVAALRGREATRDLAKVDLARSTHLFNRGAVPREELDQRITAVRADEAAVQEALEQVHEARVALGLDPHPEGKDLTDVPADLNQTFSGVSEALNELLQSMTQAGFPLGSFPLCPGRPSTSSASATRTGTSTASWSG